MLSNVRPKKIIFLPFGSRKFYKIVLMHQSSLQSTIQQEKLETENGLLKQRLDLFSRGVDPKNLS